jgi:hypothetical protein
MMIFCRLRIVEACPRNRAKSFSFPSVRFRATSAFGGAEAKRAQIIRVLTTNGALSDMGDWSVLTTRKLKKVMGLRRNFR